MKSYPHQLTFEKVGSSNFFFNVLKLKTRNMFLTFSGFCVSTVTYPKFSQTKYYLNLTFKVWATNWFSEGAMDKIGNQTQPNQHHAELTIIGSFEFFLDAAELWLNSVISVISGSLINQWSMNWAQFQDPVSHICLADPEVANWSLTQEVADLNSVKTFRKNSIYLTAFECPNSIRIFVMINNELHKFPLFKRRNFRICTCRLFF